MPHLGDDPILADGKVMFHGQPVFAVIAIWQALGPHQKKFGCTTYS